MTWGWAVPVALVALSGLVMALCIVHSRNVGRADRSKLDMEERRMRRGEARDR